MGACQNHLRISAPIDGYPTAAGSIGHPSRLNVSENPRLLHLTSPAKTAIFKNVVLEIVQKTQEPLPSEMLPYIGIYPSINSP
jgi:hypothetical protein